MTTYRLVQLPFSTPPVFFVRKTEAIKKRVWFFLKKEEKGYTDSTVGTIQQINEYIKSNNIEISKTEIW